MQREPQIDIDETVGLESEPTAKPGHPAAWKYAVIVRGRGTANELRRKVAVKLYWCRSLQRYVSIPEA